jgi:hypothetical protein
VSFKRFLAMIAWGAGWTAFFGLQLAADFSILGAAGCVFWIVGGCYCTATSRWHEVFAGLRWREMRVALLYIAVVFGVFVAVVQLTSVGDAGRAVRVVILTVLVCPAVLFVPTFMGIRAQGPAERGDAR